MTRTSSKLCLATLHRARSRLALGNGRQHSLVLPTQQQPQDTSLRRSDIQSNGGFLRTLRECIYGWPELYNVLPTQAKAESSYPQYSYLFVQSHQEFHSAQVARQVQRGYRPFTDDTQRQGVHSSVQCFPPGKDDHTDNERRKHRRILRQRGNTPEKSDALLYAPRCHQALDSLRQVASPRRLLTIQKQPDDYEG